MRGFALCIVYLHKLAVEVHVTINEWRICCWEVYRENRLPVCAQRKDERYAVKKYQVGRVRIET